MPTQNPVDNAELVAAVLVNDIQLALEGQTGFLNTISSKSYAQLQKGRTYNVPKLGAFTAVNKVPGTALTPQTADSFVAPIVVDQNPSVVVVLDDVLAMQSDVADRDAFIANAATSLRVYKETSFCGLYTEAGSSVGSNAVALTSAMILDLQLAFDEAKIPQEGRYLVLAPRQAQDIMKDADFKAFNANRGPNDSFITGQIGMLYGFNIVKSAYVVNTGTALAPELHGVAYWEGAIGLVDQEMIRAKSAYSPTEGGEVYNIGELYGVGVIEATGVIDVVTGIQA